MLLDDDDEPEEPDCEQCDRPRLFPQNRIILELWELLNHWGRDQGYASAPMSISKALDLVRARGETWETFENILLLESVIEPILHPPDEHK